MGNPSRFFICFICLILLCIFGNNLYSQEKVRVMKEGAVLRVQPDSNSKAIYSLPLGAIFEYEEMSGGWVRIKLSPNEQGITIIGYVNAFYVETIKTETTISFPSSIKQETIKSTPKDFEFSLQEELRRAKSSLTAGAVLVFAGFIILPVCMVLTFTDMEYVGWGKLKARTPYIIGDAIGLVSFIAGLAISIPASGRVKELEEQRRTQLSLKLGSISSYNAVGFQVRVSF